ncbi:polyamine-modulated factor 1 [Neodiprion lecontei]|uniref:Polyamine-modulated factor 1 n=1 Tax=Neodiprion lecontei TaxID=441921 RepID=A0A6J0BZY8_NEOLC|nr:polyamine-modulated factor 1 [Neodiprion lecontei]
MVEEGSITAANCPKDLLLFRAAISRIFRDIAESVSADEFWNSWTVLKQKRKLSQQLYTLMVDTLYENMVTRIDEFIAEDDLIEKFNVLKRIIDETDTPRDHVAWRPPGNVMEHLRSLDGEKIKQHSEKLEEYVTTMEAENKKLAQQVSKGRKAASTVNAKADCLLEQHKYVRSEFERAARHLEGDIKKMSA